MLEALESRLLLSGSVLITELMADNNSYLADGDGNFSDWIEIYNPTAVPVNLTGWYLTDNASDLTQWAFPGGSLGAGQYMVVFASNGREDVSDPVDPNVDAGGNLHTNFALSASGEYLAVVHADPVPTVVHAYDPDFPAQFDDVAYGLRQNVSTTTLSPGAPLTWLVPSGAAQEPTWGWADVGFDDSSWTAGISSVGYGDFSGTGGVSLIHRWGFDEATDDVAIDSVGGAHGTIYGGAALSGTGQLTLDGVDDYVDLPNDLISGLTDATIEAWGTWQGGLPWQRLFDFGTSSDGEVTGPGGSFTAEGGLSLAASSDTSGLHLSVKPDGQADTYLMAPTILRADTEKHVAIIYDGSADLMRIYVNRTPYGVTTTTVDLGTLTNVNNWLGRSNSSQDPYFAGQINEFRIHDGAMTSLQVRQSLRAGPGGWTGATTIGTDVQAEMQDVTSSAYVRIPFSVPDPAAIDGLTLKMRYDDGFRAYLNGREIASSNAPETPAWNSQATAERTSGETESETFVVSLAPGELRTDNILAIQGFNISAGDGDFLILPELIASNTHTGQQRYFVTPTPGDMNDSAFRHFVADTKFSVDRGFFDTPFDVTITTETPGAAIYYTLDGAEPAQATATPYSGPIHVSATTTLRAAAYRMGYESSNADTQTYIFLDDVVTQSPYGSSPGPGWPAPGSVNGQRIIYGMDPDIVGGVNTIQQVKDSLLSIPTISMVTDLDHLFSASTGIFVNARSDGIGWERPASFELIYPENASGPGFPDGADDGFQVDAGVRIRGGYSRSGSNPKHAFRLFFRNEYGDAKLKYPLFGDEGADQFDKVDLRTSQNYSWAFGGPNNNTMVRDIYSRDLQGEMGHEYTRGRYYHLYINGVYWGVFQTDERPEASFAETYYGGDRSDYDVIKPDDSRRVYATDGSLAAYNRLWSATTNIGYANMANYYRVQGMNVDGTRNDAYERLLDVDNIIDYMIITYYTGDRDGPGSWYTMGGSGPNNFFAIYNRNDPDGFKFFEHDSEHSLGTGENNMVLRGGQLLEQWSSIAHLQDRFAPHWLHEQLVDNPDYRLRFADRLYKALYNDGPLTYENSLERINYRAAQVDQAMIAESARWGDTKVSTPKTQQDWVNNVNSARNWISNRVNTVLSQVRSVGWYPYINPPTFNRHGGPVGEGFQAVLSASAGTIWYTTDGSDPRAHNGTVSTSAVRSSTPLVLSESGVIRTRALSGAQWSPLNEADFFVGPQAGPTNLAITELNYHPHDPTPAELAIGPTFSDDDFEFVEMRNVGPERIELTGVSFTGDVTFTFGAAGTVYLDPGRYVVIAANQAAFEARYGTGVPIAGTYEGDFGNAGDTVTVVGRLGHTIHDFTYRDDGPWPGRADGKGSTLEVLNTTGSYGDDNNWRSSSEYGGSPGAAGTGPLADVVINEVLSKPLDSGVDAIELYNITGAPVDIGGWFLTDDNDDYRAFEVPAGTIIGAGGYVVFTAGTGFTFALSASGEEVWLVEADAAGNLLRFADHAGFGAALAGVSFGRWPDGTGDVVMLQNVTLGAANSLPRVGRIVINEIHANPDIKTEAVEFIELFNATSDPVDMSGWYFSDGVAYTFPAGTVLAPGGFAVVSEDPSALLTKYGVSSFGPYTGKLSNEGETLTLCDAAGIEQDGVDYGLGFPWPTVGDEPGYSIELIDPTLDNDLGGSWRASAGSQIDQQLVFDTGGAWKYFKGRSEPSATQGAWRLLAPAYDDSSWPAGIGAIGYSSEANELSSINTILGDMKGGYTTVYFRKEFTLSAAQIAGVNELLLDVLYDDAFNVWINGTWLDGVNAGGQERPYNATAGSAIDNPNLVPRTISDPAPQTYLVAGTNVIAAQILNASISNSSDAFWDARLTLSLGGSSGVTPGAVNSVYSTGAAPQMRQVSHTPNAPTSAQAVTITMKVTDPDGVAAVTADYQAVAPGDYISKDDPRYSSPANWTTVAMYDDGTNGDATAGDDVYTTVLPAQPHRTLVRYRVTASDTLGAEITGPYWDDPQSNFAYFVYNGVPDWTGAVQPGVTAPVTYDSTLLQSIPVYHLITTNKDHVESQYVPDSTAGQDWSNNYIYDGALVYNGVVYDHITYRPRGGVHRFKMGKNMWKFDFNRGHYFQALDDRGVPFDTQWDKLNFSAIIQQGNFNQRGEQGLFEAAGFALHNMAGNPAPKTNYVHFRIVEYADEGPTGYNNAQYDGDFQGLYLTLEQLDGRFLEEHDLPDGNFYKMEGGSGTLNNQGPTHPADKSDLNAFMNGYKNSPTLQWWQDNVDLDDYYNFRAISMAIHDYDMHAGKNYFYYHNPETDKWSIVNWDLDLCWTTTYNGGGGHGPLYDNSPFVRLLDVPELRLDYNNRVRELVDLLFNLEQTGMLLDEMASFVYTPGTDSIVDADRAMWDYNPIMSSSYIRTDKTAPGWYYRNSPTDDYAGMIQIMKNYVADKVSNYLAGGTYAFDPKVASDEGLQPDTPTLTYLGAAGHPMDGLDFQSSAFASTSPGASFGAMEWRIARVTDTADPAYDPYNAARERYYEIDPVWESGELTLFDDTVTVVGHDLIEGEVYRVRVRMKDSFGRWSHWSAPAQFAAGLPAGAVVTGLKITELNYAPYGPTAAELATQAPGDTPFGTSDFEFVELRNTSAETIDLAGVKLTTAVTFDFTGSAATSLAPDQYVVVAKRIAAFEARYGTGINVAGEFSGKLKNEGELFMLPDGFDRMIQAFTYDNSGAWPGRADGKGSSLEVIDVNGNYNDDSNWRASGEYGGSPGRAGAGPVNDVLINEVLAHSDYPQVDSIELHNTTGADINIGGWWLSDTSGSYRKFQVPAGTVIPAGQYVVFYEGHYVGATLAYDPVTEFGGPGPDDFGLSGAEGDDVWLLETNGADRLTRFADHVEFGASLNGESFGRWPNGVGDLYPMEGVTLNAANWGPRIGPLLINEVMYNKPDPDGAGVGVDPADLEFIEILNPTAGAVNLWETYFVDGANRDYPWKVEGFDFAVGTTLGAGELLVVVGFDPLTQPTKLATFKSQYDITDPSAKIVGPFSGVLDNGGEAVRLRRADEPPIEDTSVTPYIIIDEVIYDDAAPWPASADGLGDSLNRNGQAWGNDPASWAATTPTPCFFSTDVSALPTGVDLADAFDTGASDTDNVTRLDNSTPGAALQFDIAGTVSGATITVYADGLPIGSAAATGETATVTTTGTADLPDGAHLITARQAEPGKAASAYSAALVIAVDTVAPTAGVPDLAGATDTGVSATDNVTRGAAPQFVGAAGDVGSGVWKVEVTSDDARTATDDAGGAAYNVTLGALDEGSRTITAKAHDRAGNTFTTASLVITVDRTPPVAGAPDLRSVSDTGASDSDNITKGAAPLFDGTASDLASGLWKVEVVSDDARSAVCATGEASYTATLATLDEGARAVTATAHDRAGNTFTTASLAITVDRSAPVASVPDLAAGRDTGKSDSDDVTQGNAPQFNGLATDTGSGMWKVDVASDDGKSGSDAGAPFYSVTLAALDEGPRLVTATAFDLAGNTFTTPALRVSVDRTAPAASTPDLAAASDTGESNSDDITRGIAPRFDGTAEDADSGLWKVDVTSDDGKIGTEATGGTAYGISLAMLDEGSRTVTATAHDVAGNMFTTGGLAVTVDRTAPTVETFGVTNDAWALGTVDSSTWMADRSDQTVPWTIINQLALGFGEPVIARAGDLTLDGAAHGMTTAAAVAGSGTAEVTWTVTPAGQYLATDRCAVSLPPTVTDVAGNALAGGWTADLNVAIGDINGDGRVSSRDRRGLRDAYGSSDGNAAYSPFADLNADGRISSRDRRSLRDYYGSSLPSPPPGPAPPADGDRLTAAPTALRAPAAGQTPQSDQRSPVGQADSASDASLATAPLVIVQAPSLDVSIATSSAQSPSSSESSPSVSEGDNTPSEAQLEPELSSGLIDPLE